MSSLAAVAGFGIATLIVSMPVAWLSARGGFGAQAAYERALNDLDQNGRTSIRANFLARLFRVGPIDLDARGFTFHQSSIRQTCAWSDIQKPLSIESTGRYSYGIVFYVLIKNRNFRKRRIFANTKDEFLQRRCELSWTYSTGQYRLLELMNRLRNQALAAGKEEPGRHLSPA